MQLFTQWGLLALIMAALSGCSWGGGDAASAGPCQANPSTCLFEGAYEPGERDYAETEARRLNQAEVNRLRQIRL